MKFMKKVLTVFLLALALHTVAGERLESIYRERLFPVLPHSRAEKTVKEFADANGLSYGDYPRSLVELLERNPETEEFVLGYPLYEPEEYDLSDFDGEEGVPLFLQWDPRWGYEPYGSDMIAITGCGPACLAMVGYHLTGNGWYTPENVAAFAQREGFYSDGNGSSWTLISQGAVELGFDVTEIPLVERRITDNLEVGNPIIAVVGPGDFTDSGHYIVLTGVENGMIRVNDPNSRENSGKLWSYDCLAEQIRNIWVIRYFK